MEYECFFIQSYRSVSSLQWGSFSPSENRFSPESSSLFSDRSSSLRCEGFDLRAEARAAQPSSVTPHLPNLWRTMTLFWVCILSQAQKRKLRPPFLPSCNTPDWQSQCQSPQLKSWSGDGSRFMIEKLMFCLWIDWLCNCMIHVYLTNNKRLHLILFRLILKLLALVENIKYMLL